MEQLSRLFDTASQTVSTAYQFQGQLRAALRGESPTLTALRATHTQAQIYRIFELRALVASLQTPKDGDLKEKPEESTQRIDQTLQIAEQSLGSADAYYLTTLVNLGQLYAKKKDWTTSEKYYTQLLVKTEKGYGRRNKHMLGVLQVKAGLYFLMKDYDNAMEVQLQVSELESSMSLGEVPERILEFWVLTNKLTPVAWDRAEEALRRNVSTFEQKYDQEHHMWTTAIHQLIAVCAAQCHNRLSEDPPQPEQALRYILEVIMLSRRATGIRRHVCNRLVRMCVWTKLEHDVVEASRQVFAVEEDGKPKCMGCGQDEHTESEAHKNAPTCDMCKESFTKDVKRHICRTCKDVDICGDCYAQEDAEKTAKEPFLSTCRDHVFFELPEYDLPKTSYQVWIQDLQDRVSAELDRISGEMKNHHPTGTFEPGYVYEGSNVAEFAEAAGDTIVLPGYHIDKVEHVFHLEPSRLRLYAGTFWHLNRALTSPTSYSHRRLPSRPLVPLLARQLSTSISTLDFPAPFYAKSPTLLSYQSTQVTIFLTTLSQLSDLAADPKVKRTRTYRSFSGSERFAASGWFGALDSLDTKVSRVVAGIETRLLRLLEYFNDRTGTDILGAGLFDYENLVGQIEGLSVPRKEVVYESTLRQVLGEMMKGVMTGLGSVDDVGEKSGDGTQETDDEDWKSLPRARYDELQDIILDCESRLEVVLRVKVVLLAVATFRKLGQTSAHVDTVSPHHLQQCVTTLRDTEKYWHKSVNKQHTRSFSIAKQLIDLYAQTQSALDALGASPTSSPELDINSFLTFSPTEQKLTIDRALCELERRVFIYRRDSTASDEQTLTLRDMGKDTDRSGDESDSNDYVVVQGLTSPKYTLFTTTYGFVGSIATEGADIEPGDPLLLAENAKLPIVARKVEDSDMYSLVEFARVREFGDDWRDTEELGRLQKMAFKIRT